MKVLFDINLAPDVLLVRQPWHSEAVQVWDAKRERGGRFKGANSTQEPSPSLALRVSVGRPDLLPPATRQTSL